MDVTLNFGLEFQKGFFTAGQTNFCKGAFTYDVRFYLGQVGSLEKAWKVSDAKG